MKRTNKQRILKTIEDEGSDSSAEEYKENKKRVKVDDTED